MSHNQHKLNSSNNKPSVFSVLKTTLLAASVSVLAACSGGGGGSEPAPKSDTKAPTVTKVQPANGAEIAKNQTITVTFSENVKDVNTNNVSLTKSGSSNSADLTIAGSGKTYTIKPNADLEAGASYTLTLKKAIADTAGNKLAANVIKTYRVESSSNPAPNPDPAPAPNPGGGTTDTTAPTVSANPANGALGGDADKTPTITLTFSEAVKNVNATNVELKKTGATNPVTLTIGGSGKVYTVKPSADLEAGAYTLTLKVGITDNANNPLATAQSYSYTVTYTATAEVSIITPQTLLKTGGDVRISGKRLNGATVGFGPQNLRPSEQTDTLIKVTLPAQSVGTKSIKVGQSTHSVTFKDNYTKIVSGFFSIVSCGLLPNKTVECWGGEFLNSPKPISGLSNVIDMAVGDLSYCVLLVDKTVKCWGKNNLGQLGDNTNNDRKTPALVKDSAGTGHLRNVTKLAIGREHACALIDDSTIQCWGKNTEGQLGNNSYSNVKLPVTVSNINNAKEITVGNAHTCAILTDSSVKCWGSNGTGQLGSGNKTPSNVPVAITGLQAKTISAGYIHTCAVLNDAQATAKCWGFNGNGQLGDGSRVEKNAPTAVSGISNVASISAGYSHTCAMLKDGKAKCWGNNRKGKLGNNNTAQVTSPVDVVSPSGSRHLANVTSIVSAAFHTCATIRDKPTHCWGDNSGGRLGNGRYLDSKVPTPMVIANEALPARNMSNVKQVATGNKHHCSILLDNSVKCWGEGDNYQLGTGNRSRPVSIDAAVKANRISNAKEVAVGALHTCALLADKTIKCWGGNSTDYKGELGDGYRESATPILVKGINNATQLSVAGFGQHGCALLDDGSVKCWGDNKYAQIGDGTTTKTLVPKAVKNLSNATQVAISGSYSCALLKNNTVKCWGSNKNGQLGVATTTTTDTCSNPAVACSKAPIQVTNLSNVTQIAVGHEHACALLGGGSIKCWGKNTDGQLGNNSTTSSPSPVAVSGISTAQKLVLGHSHSCALLANKSVKCWGKNTYGLLGSSVRYRKVPVNIQVNGKVDDISAGTNQIMLLQGSLAVPVGASY